MTIGSPIVRGYRQAPMPTDPHELREIHVNAQLANYVYTRDPTTLPRDWAPSSDLAGHLHAALNLPPAPQVQRAFGTLVDAETGLVATVLVSPQMREVVLAFGGTTAGAVAGSALPRVIGNFSTMVAQWQANIGAGLGSLPASYRQAAAAVQALTQVVGHGPWAGYSLRAVGHSKGAGEAAYAALVQRTPLRADVFSPSHLSHGITDQLPGANVLLAPDLVRSYSVETDLVPALRNLPRSLIDGVGTEHFVPVDLPTGTSLLSVHERFVQHLEGYMRRCENVQGGS